MPTLLVASSNAGKLAEFALAPRLLARPGEDFSEWSLDPLPGFAELPACEEDRDSFAGNAQKKALHFGHFATGPVLADDSGLEVAALGGAPGVYSARYAGPAASAVRNNAKLLDEMSAIPPEMRSARFVCEIALARHGKLLGCFGGSSEGLILPAPRGQGGFGYDPLFLDPQLGKTYAQLTTQEKMQRSHRGKALRALLEWLAGQPRMPADPVE